MAYKVIPVGISEAASLFLPNAGAIVVGGPINGSAQDVQAELDQFYLGLYQVVADQPPPAPKAPARKSSKPAAADGLPN